MHLKYFDMSRYTVTIIVMILLIFMLTFLLYFNEISSLSEADSSSPHETMSVKQLIALDFEVFGLVQGVFFRKYTMKTGKQLGLRGWCMNTRQDTVLGQLEGEKPAIEEMKKWLSTTGSPSSRIDKAEFRNEKLIEKYSFKDFSVRH